MSIWRWRDRFPTLPREAELTLGEGNTPLLRSRRIGPAAGMEHLYFKLETTNPTGSYKDRFAAVGVSAMRAGDRRVCLATSSGNSGAALAAYCAAAEITCLIAIVETAPAGKLQQMLAYGARLYRISGFGLDPRVTAHVFALLEQAAAGPEVALQISAFRYAPIGMAGVQSIAYEIHEQLHGHVDHVFCPAGGGGLALAVARGFAESAGRGPAIHCVQPAGNDTIVSSLNRGEIHAQAVNCATTISGLQVPSVVDGDAVIAACRASSGQGHLVMDDDVYVYQSRLAREEGIYCEPAGAVAAAAAVRAVEAGQLSPDAHIVCLVTGSGFKDPASIERANAQHHCPTVTADTFADLLASTAVDKC